MRYTFLKNLLLKLDKNISMPWRQKIESNVRFKTLNKGKIDLGIACSIRENTLLSANGGNIKLGNNCFINRNVIIASHKNITVGNKTTIGPNVCIYDHDHDMYNRGGFISDDVEIGEKVWIGAGAIILKGSKIKDGAVVAAGTVVCGEVEPNTIVLDKRSKVYKTIER